MTDGAAGTAEGGQGAPGGDDPEPSSEAGRQPDGDGGAQEGHGSEPPDDPPAESGEDEPRGGGPGSDDAADTTAATTDATLDRAAGARWHAGIVAAIASAAVGLAGGVPAFLWLAVVPLGYAVYGYASGVPAPEVAVSRTVGDEQPAPGDRVEVTVEITNRGDRPLADLRVADGPPDVPREGAAALATALRPGESETFSYELSVPRGSFEFDDATVRVRSLAGAAVASEAVAVDGPDRLDCGTALDEMPLREETIQYVGRTPTDTGGSGVEFHSAREYRRGDPVRRIDWRRYARTGDLTTVQLREERAMTVVFLLDDRPGVQRSQPGYGPDSLDLASYAVSRALAALAEADHRVGVATLAGIGGARPGEVVDPGGGHRVRTAAEATLDAVEDRDRPDGTDGVAARLAEWLPAHAQVVLCTPLVDGLAAGLADALEPRGHPVTVLSPDMSSEAAGRLDETWDDAAGRTTRTDGRGGVARGQAGSDDPDDRDASALARAVAGLERENRVAALRSRGVPVVDWDLADPLALALAETFDRLGTTGLGSAGGDRPRPTGQSIGPTAADGGADSGAGGHPGAPDAPYSDGGDRP